MKTLLHAGCGPATIADLDWIKGPDGEPLFKGWKEIRLDIDDKYGADIVGDIRDSSTWALTNTLAQNIDQQADAVFCSHVLEHLHLYDVPRALRTFRDVLVPNGTLMLVVPNFLVACRHIIEGGGTKLYDSPAGPIHAHEVIYGKEDWTADNQYQRHLTGMTPDLVRGLLAGCGFQIAQLHVDHLNIFAIAGRGDR